MKNESKSGKTMRAIRNWLFVASIVLLSLIFNNVTNAETSHSEGPKNVILFIGDGMGANQIKATEIYSKQVLNKDLAMGLIKITGNTTTHSASSPVTDSAAAATALYTGHKTINGRLNVLPDDSQVEGIGKIAKKAGLSVGMISTSRITDATPAAIYAVSSSRGEHNKIAEHLPKMMAEVVLGVGRRNFIPRGHVDSDRKDETDLIAIMKENGYEFVENAQSLASVDTKNVKRLFGLFAPSNMPYAIDRKNNQNLKDLPTLADMTNSALSILQNNPRGFLLMVEGGRIDHACHSHDIKTMIEETLEFDDAIHVALNFQKKHPDTLIIVTADHETGGLKQAGIGSFDIDSHALEPIKHSLTHIQSQIKKKPQEQKAILKSAGIHLNYEEAEFLGTYLAKTVKEKPGAEISSKYDPGHLVKALSQIVSKRAGIEWTTNGHTEASVITRAIGPGAELFSGDYDNTDIPANIARLLKFELPKPSEKVDKKTKLEGKLKKAA